MAIIKAVNSKASIGKGINYITKEEKTEEKLITAKDCNPNTAINEMKAIKELYNKTDGRQYKHYIMSFSNDDKVNFEKAYEIGKKFMENEEKFKNHQVIMATHKDKDHVHNHFIVNSVNMENGKKYQESKKDLEKMKSHLKELSKEYDFKIPEKSQEQGKITSFNQDKYQIMKKHFEGKARSYVIETAIDVSKAREQAISKDDFIKKMEQQNYKVNWSEDRKHVTFINKDNQKVRLSNLEKTFNDKTFSKGELINEFERNKAERTKEEEFGRNKEPGSREEEFGKSGESTTIDWRKVERELDDRDRRTSTTVGDEKNRISEQSRDEVTKSIYRETDRAREEVERATTGIRKKKREKSRGTKSNNKGIGKNKQPIKDRPSKSFGRDR